MGDLVEWKHRLDAVLDAAGPSLSDIKSPLTLVGRQFPVLTGGAPVSCGTSESTVAFCWTYKEQPSKHCSARGQNNSCRSASAAENETQCLTVFHVRRRCDEAQNHCKSLRLNISGRIAHGSDVFHWVPQVADEDYRDVLVIKVPSSEHAVSFLKLLYSRHEVPVVGHTSAEPGDAVWKLGYQTALSTGRVTEVYRDGLLVEGIAIEPGDSGGPICLADSYTQCTLVGMVVHVNNHTRELRGVSSRFLGQNLPYWPLNFTTHPRHIAKQVHDEKARLEDEKAQLQSRVEMEKADKAVLEYQLRECRGG